MNKLCSNSIYISESEKSAFFYRLLFLIFIFCLVVLLLYRNAIGGLPIESVFSGLDQAALALLRSEATNNFQGRAYLYFLFIKTVPLLLLIIVYLIRSKGFNKWNVFYYMLLLYNIFISISDFQKGPIIKLVLIFLVLYFYKVNGIKYSSIVKSGIFVVVLIIGMYILFMGQGDKNILKILESAAHRIFVGQISPLYWWYRYEEQFGLLYGRSFPNPGGIFPFENVPITVKVDELSKVGTGSLETVGSMPTVFFANWYVNFGTIVSLLSMIIFGFIIQLFDTMFINKLAKKRTVLTSSLFVYVIYFFSKYTSTGFEGILFDADIVFPFLLVAALVLVNRTKSKLS
jgi:oligosaccharide repeat unit polymerase